MTRDELIEQIATCVKWGMRFSRADAAAIVDRVPIISTAPRMLEVLEAFVEPFILTSDETLQQFSDIPQPRNVLKARAAIAAATEEKK